MDSKHVFISSTTSDLAEYRQEAVNVINALNEYKGRFQLVEMTMDNQGQSGERETPVDISTRWIGEADWIVLIVAWNYGYVQEGEERSVTEWEYRFSQENCNPPKKCFVFLAGETTDGNMRYEYKRDKGEKNNLTDWDRRPSEHLEDWLKDSERLQCFKKKLREDHCELFSDIDDFRQKLKNTLKKKIDIELPPSSGFEEILKDRALLELILAQRKPMQDYISEIKQLATIKRVHDHLHCIRQFGVCRWRDEVLNLWEQGPIDGDGKEVFLDVLGNIREERGALKDLKLSLPRDPCCRLDELIAAVLEFTFPMRRDLPTLARTTFERTVDDFGRTVQKAFSAADLAMRGRKDALRKQHTTLIKGLSEARKNKALSAAQDQLLNDGLDLVEQRLNQMDTVFEHHSRWQGIHNALEDLDLCAENHFRGELNVFLKSNRREVLALLDDAETVLSAVTTADRMSETNKIKALVGIESDQTGADTIYASMRKAFDTLFFQVDKETLAFVDQSEERIKKYEATLQDLENQVRGRAVAAR